MPFNSPLQTERIWGTDNLKVIREYIYYWKVGSKLRKVVVPVGFITDQASVPKLIMPIVVDNTGKITDAAVPHDYLYGTKELHDRWTKADADAMFHDAMIEAGMKPWRAAIAYAGVRSNLYAAWKWNR